MYSEWKLMAWKMCSSEKKREQKCDRLRAAPSLSIVGRSCANGSGFSKARRPAVSTAFSWISREASRNAG